MKFVNILKDVGLKATPQRVAVLRELYKKNHPTIDEIYENIKIENPSISLATVYKNLAVLRDVGLVVEIHTPSKKIRYDYFRKPHLHIVCSACGSIKDEPYDSNFFIYKSKFEEEKSLLINRLDVVAITKNCEFC